MRFKLTVAYFLLMCSGYTVAHASSFLVGEQDAKAMSMGNAFAAISDNPSANWYNPAGLSFQENASSINLLYSKGSNEYAVGGKTYSEQGTTQVLPQIYTVYRLENSDITFGMGINSPFKLDTDWTTSNAPFSQVLASADGVTLSQIQTIHINPNIAYQFGEYFSAAVGVSYYNAYKVHLDNPQLKFGGSGDGFGNNVGLMFRSDYVNVGLSYRSSVNVDIVGTVAGGGALALVALEGVGANATTSFILPDITTLGISINPFENVTLSFQAEKVNWATLDEININHDTSVLDSAVGGTSTAVLFGWKATISKHVGVDWRLTDSSSLRLGYATIPSPLTLPSFSSRAPLGDARLVSLGYGVTFFDSLVLDMAYSQTSYADYTVTSPALEIYQGVYTSKSQQFIAGLTYRF